MSLSEQQRDELLLGMHRDVGVVKHATGSIRQDVDDLKRAFGETSAQVAAIATRQEDHTGRIHLLEGKNDEHGKGMAVLASTTGQDRAKLAGIWVGITALIATVATVVNVIVTLTRK